MFEKALLDYLIEFHAKRDYFECHEILEERWKEDTKENQQRFWVALIQVAVGFYHYRRNNVNGAKKMFERAMTKLKTTETQLEALGIQVAELINILEMQVIRIEKKMPYESIHIPLKDSLLQACLAYCEDKKITFLQVSDLTDIYLLNKHSLRSR